MSPMNKIRSRLGRFVGNPGEFSMTNALKLALELRSDEDIDVNSLRVEQIRSELGLAPVTMVTNVVASGLVIYMCLTDPQINVAPYTALLFVWMFGHWIFSIINIVRWIRSRQIINSGELNVSEKRIHSAVYMSVFIGALWGVFMLTVFPMSSAEQRVIIIAILAGTSSCMVFSLKLIPRAATLGIAVMFIPTLYSFMTLGDPLFLVLSVLLVTYFFAIIITVGSTYQQLVEGLLTQQVLTDQSQVIGLLLREFEENASDWLWETDTCGRLTYVSSRFAEVAKVAKSVLQGVGLRQSAKFSGISHNWRTLEQHMQNRVAFNDLVVEAHIEGQRRWWSITAKPIFDGANLFAGYRGVGKDVTKTQQDAHYLRRAKEEAESANIAKSRFLATISHELRTPLNAIVGFSDLLVKQRMGPIENPLYIEYAGDIKASGEHLMSLINDLLEFASLESEDATITEQQVNINYLLESVERLNAQSALANGVTLINDGAPETIEIRGDERRLRQVMINLVANAIKFTPEGGTVHLRGHVTPDAVALVVEDTGIGVTEDDIETIFDPFKQLDDDLHRSRSGVGLGLSICKKLVEAHGGTITFLSTPEKGSTVTVSLPISRQISLRQAGGSMAKSDSQEPHLRLTAF